MNKAQQRLARWLGVTGAIYAAGAVDFTARPRAATRSLNQAGGAPLPDEEPGVYNALASAYMATIAALALTAARDPERNQNLVQPLLVAKATSSAGLLLRYFKTRRRGFAMGAALDALIFGVTAGLLAAADEER
ncbi:MAG: hypothetical protein M3198_06735 [Actinomycetota bacterium]|nr:hypothetical protein [Actinomycetota bacterium]